MQTERRALSVEWPRAGRATDKPPSLGPSTATHAATTSRAAAATIDNQILVNINAAKAQ